MGANATSTVAKVLDPVLVARGFTRSGYNWYREHPDSILLINLQPAKYSPGPYVNFCVYYRKYGNLTRPTDVDCHLRMRLEAKVHGP